MSEKWVQGELFDPEPYRVKTGNLGLPEVTPELLTEIDHATDMLRKYYPRVAAWLIAILSEFMVKQSLASEVCPMGALAEWHDAIEEKRIWECDDFEIAQLKALRAKLIAEEAAEAVEVLDESGPLVDLAKELADVLYVVYGTAEVFGIPLCDVFFEVHKSNMTKVGPDGKVKRNEIGKVLKGDHYQPPNIVEALGIGDDYE